MAYDCGYIISKSLRENVDALLDRIKKKKASLIILDGQQGEGKTTLAVGIGDYIEQGKINLKEQLALGGDDFLNKLNTAINKNYKVVIYDEGGDFNKRGAISSFNQRINRIFETFRAYGILVIICLPCFNVLDNNLFLNGVPRMLVNCHNRTATNGSVRGYALNEMFYLKHYMKKEVNPLRAYCKVTPNFRGHFKDLTKKRSEELHEISLEAKRSVLNAELEIEGLYSYKDMAQELGISWQHTKRMVSELGIDPDKIHKRKKYFSEEVVEVLRQHQVHKK